MERGGIREWIGAGMGAVILAWATLAAGTGCAQAEEPATVTTARLGIHGTTTRFVAEFSDKQAFSLFTLADPDRVVVDLPPLNWTVPETAAPAGRGLVAAYRYGLFRPDAGRLVLDLSGPARVSHSEWIPPRDGHLWRLIIDLEAVSRGAFVKTAGWPKAKAVAETTAADPPAPAPVPKPDMPGSVVASITPAPVPRVAMAMLPAAEPAALDVPDVRADANPPTPDQEIPNTRGLPVIVIDPGHGGVDPGASAGDGTFEKDVVLAVALELASALQSTQRYQVRLTRSGDTFLKLKERVDFARHAKADLFISLHADALTSNPKVGGLSIYTLSEKASDKEAEALASKENRADVIGGVDLSSESDDVTMILIDLAQRETMNQSIQFAHTIASDLKGETHMVKNGIRQAGFRVLKAPDVCSVLIELGYLSNAADLKRITSEDWRANFAKVVTRAVDQHFSAYDGPGEQRSAWRQ